MIYEIAAGLTAYAAGLASGAAIWYRPNIPTDEQIAKYMGRVVNLEELEEHRRLLRVKMIRAGQKTQRFDGGPNARIMRMKLRPGRKGK